MFQQLRDGLARVRAAFSHHDGTGAIHGDAEAVKDLFGGLVLHMEELQKQVEGEASAIGDKAVAKLREAISGVESKAEAFEKSVTDELAKIREEVQADMTARLEAVTSEFEKRVAALESKFQPAETSEAPASGGGGKGGKG